MILGPLVGRVTVQLLHRVRVEHGLTGGGVPVRAAVVGVAPRGWAVAVHGDSVVVTGRDGTASLTPPHSRLRLAVTDARTAARLAQPVAEVDLVADEQVHRFTPAPATVTLKLTDGDGQPRSGADVGLTTATGTAVAMDEVSARPGTYRCDARTWTAEELPAELLVEGAPQRRLGLDPLRPDTRLRLVLPS